ncbi:hypothetical protein ACFQ7N_40665 [Streptomyces niveus]|uniref:hypothetical protein n=1 Tax=Streptomyces niveus TaxID=193462 RepID=UPI0036906003
MTDITTEFPEAALAGLRDRLMAAAADEGTTPMEELEGFSDEALAAYWYGYVKASANGSTGEALHVNAFGESLFPAVRGVNTETGQLRAALVQSFK